MRRPRETAPRPSHKPFASYVGTLIAESPYENMAELSSNELKAVIAHPIGKGLDTSLTKFRSRYLKSEKPNVTEIADQFTSEALDGGKKYRSRVQQRLLIGDRSEKCDTRSRSSSSKSGSSSSHSLANRK